MSVLAKLSPSERLYWSRQEKELKALLTKGKIDFLPESIGKQKMVPALGVSKRNTLGGGPFLPYYYADSLADAYPATEPMEAFACELACDLFGKEVTRLIRSKFILKESLFTPEQVRWIAKEQNKDGLGKLLDFEKVNYFPILGKNNKILYLSLFWKRNMRSFKTPQENKWDIFISSRDDRSLKSEGLLFLLRELI